MYLAHMTIPLERSDRLDVPATLETGARRVPVVILRPGVMRYPWGVERTDAATLADPEFVGRIPGIPVKLGRDLQYHPTRPVRVGTDDGTLRIGTVLSARWDAEEQGIVGEIVIDEPAGLQAHAQGIRGLSLKYRAEVVETSAEDRADGATLRRVRVYDPEHLLVTTNPRGGAGTSIRADGGAMEPELTKALENISSLVTKLGERMDALEKPKEKADDSDRADTAGEWRTVLAAADASAVKIDNNMKLGEAKKAVAKKLLGERADSLSDDALTVAIELASSRSDSTGQTFADWSKRSGPADPNRGDAADSKTKSDAYNKLGAVR